VNDNGSASKRVINTQINRLSVANVMIIHKRAVMVSPLAIFTLAVAMIVSLLTRNPKLGLNAHCAYVHDIF
jgi:hypothetical protein